MSLKAYQKVQSTTETPRDTEHRVFARVTGMLMDARSSGERGIKLIDAIDKNRRFWSMLAADCASDANGLPEQTRAQIISLSIWVSKYSGMVTRDKQSLDPLIDINKTIMEGLALRPVAEPVAPPIAPTGT